MIKVNKNFKIIILMAVVILLLSKIFQKYVLLKENDKGYNGNNIIMDLNTVKA